MKTITLISRFVLSLILTVAFFRASAQSTLLVSNLGKTSSGAIAAGSNSQLAQFFYNNGSNPSEGGSDAGFHLDSVQLLMSNPVGSPNSFSVGIYSGASRREGPGPLVGFLNGATPDSAGVYTFTAPNITLASLTVYWLVVSGGTSVEQGSYSWNLAANNSYDSDNGSGLSPYYDSSPSGSLWTRNGSTPLQFAVYVTAIPEPSSLALLGVGGSFLFTRLARKSRSRALSQP